MHISVLHLFKVSFSAIPLTHCSPADKLADYEDELHSLKTSTSSAGVPAAGRLSLLGSRRSSPNLTAATSEPPPTPRETELATQLQREQSLRSEAETKVSQMSSELEELSAQLFQQANEMVAAERKARARLEERVEVLERREGEKRKRLERLEKAVGRIGRIRVMLGGEG